MPCVEGAVGDTSNAVETSDVRNFFSKQHDRVLGTGMLDDLISGISKGGSHIRSCMATLVSVYFKQTGTKMDIRGNP